MNNTVVLDSCVFSKLFLAEPDRDQTIALIKELKNRNYEIVVPHLFFYEVMAVAIYSKYDTEKVLNLVENLGKDTLRFIEPTSEMIKTSVAIADNGHPKSGYPSFYDSIYHAIALCLHSPFITADVRHYEKTKGLGCIVLLKDWEHSLNE